MTHPFITLRPDELVVDNFAGGGGASTGIEQAIGRPIDIAINHSPEAIAMHEANHPRTLHLCESVWDVDPIEVCAGRPVGLGWFSPDCFPAGTMILTRAGYRAIETIVVGDEVLTHERRWRQVTSTMSTVRELVRLRGHGHPGLLVSGEHPFLTRKRASTWGIRALGAPEWTRAADLDRGSYWASPAEFPSAIAPTIPSYRGRTTEVTVQLMWLVGRYIADGWARLTDTRAELVITCGTHEVEELRSKLAVWPREGARCGSDEMAWSERPTATAYQFTANHRGLVEWLREHFGHGASEKRIPGWALGMDAEMRRSLLAGYLSGDGYRGVNQGSPLVIAHTVSKALAFGIKALATTLGHSPTIYLNEKPNTVIQGRTVNALPAWSVRWRDPVCLSHSQTERADGMEWAPIRERTATGTSAEVFNLSVEEDESYVADGIVVHNCTHFSKAKGGKPRSKEIRGLAWVVIEWARKVAPRIIMLENVEEFQGWGPIDDQGHPIRERAGETFGEWCSELRTLGYELEFRALVAADYGAPTTRKRLFLIARRDGEPIEWPEPTHGKGRAYEWRPASEIVDWSLACPSIFDRQRPLADATLRRIAVGIRRYVIDARSPFVVRTPALVAPSLVQTGYGEREGQTPRALDIGKPLGTVVAGGAKHALVAALITKHYGGPNGHATFGHEATKTLGTVTTQDHHAVTTAALGTGSRSAEVRRLLDEYSPEPAHLFGTADASVRLNGERFEIVDVGMRMFAPHELFAAQGFPKTYTIDPVFEGKPLTKTKQIALAGNSVCPQVSRALVESNVRAFAEAAE